MALPPAPLPTLNLNFTLNLNCKETLMMLQLTNANRPADDPPELRRLLVAPEHVVCVEPMTSGRTRIRTTASFASTALGYLYVSETYDDVLALMLRWQEGGLHGPFEPADAMAGAKEAEDLALAAEEAAS